LMRAD